MSWADALGRGNMVGRDGLLLHPFPSVLSTMSQSKTAFTFRTSYPGNGLCSKFPRHHTMCISWAIHTCSHLAKRPSPPPRMLDLRSDLPKDSSETQYLSEWTPRALSDKYWVYGVPLLLPKVMLE